MAMQDIRKLAHEMLDEFDDEEIPEVIQKIRYLKNELNKRTNNNAFPAEDPTDDELRAINKAKREFQNGEFFSHNKLTKSE